MILVFVLVQRLLCSARDWAITLYINICSCVMTPTQVESRYQLASFSWFRVSFDIKYLMAAPYVHAKWDLEDQVS